MGFYLKGQSILTLLLSFILIGLPSSLSANARPSVSISEDRLMRKIVSVTTEQSESRTHVSVLANGKIPEHTTQILHFPPRIVVDILNAVRPFQSMTIPVKSPKVKSVRVGYHPKRIRLVLDVEGTDVPQFTTTSANRGLKISIGSENPTDEEKPKPRQENSDTKKEILAWERLTQVQEDDGQEDTTYFLKGINAYRGQNWPKAVENLDHLIKTYPEGRYTERASFLVAKAYEQLHARAALAHFTEIKGHYEDMIYRFPTSIYVPGALLSIGNLCLKIKNYYESLGYYNLILTKHKGSMEAPRAMIQKAKIFLIKDKRKEALALLEDLILRYPEAPEVAKAKIEIAKILYDTKYFKKSLDLLSELRTTNPENIYRYPEISLYLGYNYDQLGDHIMARENLFRFYNSCLDRKMNHLILTKIADTYRVEGLRDHAVKLYQLVIERYPDNEGALVSRIRLAEQQEDRKLAVKREIAPPPKIVGKEIGLANEIYEDILNNLLHEDAENPLTQLVLLKAAILYQKEKDHDKSLQTLKDFLEKYPWASLREDSKYVLLKTIGEILQEEIREENYARVLNIYQREKTLFLMINSPDLFLTIARASMHLDLEGMAVEMFKRADSLLPGQEKPPDLLFYLSRDMLIKDELKDSLARLNLLIDHDPNGKFSPRAYQLKGKILFKQKKYPQAVEMFSSALRYDLKRCERATILIDKAKALLTCNSLDKALKATREADRLRSGCNNPYPHIHQDIGDLYLNLGYPKEAYPIFKKALDIEKDEENTILLKIKIAQCYRLLDKDEDSLALFNQISNLDDPFWSKLAKAQIEEIRFNKEMRNSPSPLSPSKKEGRVGLGKEEQLFKDEKKEGIAGRR